MVYILQRGSSHLVTLIDCTKVDEYSDFYIIKIKARRRDAKEHNQLRVDKESKTDDEEVSLP